MRERCTGRALRPVSCVARARVHGMCMSMRATEHATRGAWKGGRVHAEHAYAPPGVPALRATLVLALVYSLSASHATNGFSLSLPTRPCLRARACGAHLTRGELVAAWCVHRLCGTRGVVSHAGWVPRVWGLAYHPTTRACSRVCTRACLVWYRRGEALSPASLPSVGDRVCCVVFVRIA